jgi:hypothetical protein
MELVLKGWAWHRKGGTYIKRVGPVSKGWGLARMQPAVEGAVSWERASVAAMAEVMTLAGAAAAADNAWAAAESDAERRSLEERRARSAAQDASRDVLGSIPNCPNKFPRLFWGPA